jgi:very-short-patch-repair endonuclease
LIRLGFSKDSIHRAVRAGRLHRIYPSVYAVGHARLSWRGRVAAAVLWGGPGAAASHLTAAVLRELLRSQSSAVHITVVGKGKRIRGALRVHHVRRLDPADVTVLDGIPVTSLARTLLDIAETEPPRRLGQALEQAERMKQLDLRALRETCQRNSGRRGLKPLGLAVRAFDYQAAETNPGLEREFLAFVRNYRLPKPQINVQVGPYVVDFLWPDHNLIVEADSYEFHRDRATFESDRQRDIQLALLGFTVIRLTHRRLKEEPAVVANELRALLSAW